MNDRIINYIDTIFAPYDENDNLHELKIEIITNLQEKYSDFIGEGFSENVAFKKTIESIGDMKEMLEDLQEGMEPSSKEVLVNLSASNLSESDFKNERIKGGKFHASALKGSDFSNSKIVDSTFTSSDVRETNFDNVNLVEVIFLTSDLRGCTFKNSLLENSSLDKTDLGNVIFDGTTFKKVKIKMIDLRNTQFKGCTFIETDFLYADLTGANFDNQSFDSVKFERSYLKDASFRNAVIKNVSFCSKISFTKKFYSVIKTICFDGAIMDKITYASLKGMEADLSKVTIL